MYQPPVKDNKPLSNNCKSPPGTATGRASSTKGSKRTTIQSDAVPPVNSDLKETDMKTKRQSACKEPIQTLSDTKARKTFTKIKSDDGKKKSKKERSRSGSEKGQSALSN